MPNELPHRQPAMRENTRHIRADKGIDEKRQHDADHRQTDNTPRRLYDEHDAEHTNGKICTRDQPRAKH